MIVTVSYTEKLFNATLEHFDLSDLSRFADGNYAYTWDQLLSFYSENESKIVDYLSEIETDIVVSEIPTDLPPSLDDIAKFRAHLVLTSLVQDVLGDVRFYGFETGSDLDTIELLSVLKRIFSARFEDETRLYEYKTMPYSSADFPKFFNSQVQAINEKLEKLNCKLRLSLWHNESSDLADSWDLEIYYA